jgi:Uma2 family endonuclease
VREILNGDLVTSPRPAPPHPRRLSVSGASCTHLFTAVEAAPRGWIILNEPELHLRGDVLVPDIGGWRRERMPALPSGSAFELAPDWICEVLSPSTASTDRAVKVPIDAREKVGHVWLVDPLLQTLEVLRLDGPGYRLAGVWRGDVAVQCEPFEALSIRLADLWSA